MGCLLLVAVAFIGISSMGLKSASDDVRSHLLALRNTRLSPASQELLARGVEPPQAFIVARDAHQAIQLLRDIDETGKTRPDVDPRKRAKQFHAFDLGFMVSYGISLILAALWTRGRAELYLNECKNSAACPSWLPTALCTVGLVAALVAVLADGVEYHACTTILNGKFKGEMLDIGGKAFDDAFIRRYSWSATVKWWGAGVGIAVLAMGILLSLFTPSIRARMSKTWELSLRAHRFAMRARFSVLGSALFTLLLLTGAGRDIARTVATGAFREEAGAGMITSQPDLARLGWFSLALLTLSGTCWAWARLVLAVSFDPPTTAGGNSSGNGSPVDSQVEDRLRRDLPIYYGAIPFVAAAGAFAVAPQMETAALRHPVAQVLAGALPTLLLFFFLPLVVVVFRRTSEASRASFGPLSWALTIYLVLATCWAILNLGQFSFLGFVPVALLLVALLLFGTGRWSAIFILPVLLLVLAMAYRPGWPALGKAMWPIAILAGVAVAVTWVVPMYRARTSNSGSASSDGSRRSRSSLGTADLNIPAYFGRMQLVKLIFSRRASLALAETLRENHDAVAKMTSQQARLAQADQWQTSVAPVPSPSGASPDLADLAVRRLRYLLWICAGFVILQCLHFVAVWLYPGFATTLGSGAILALGIAGWTTAGAALLFLTQATRFPILTAVIVWGVLCSSLMDNHEIRKLSGMKPPDSKTSTRPAPVGNAFEEWHKKIDLGAIEGRGKEEPPCIIVAAEGGGIRAAMWTSLVLGTLQDLSLQRGGVQQPDFASHVFGISGVSGGSVGAAVFTSICADDELRRSKSVREHCARLCGQDFLAPGLGALLYTDALQRLLPVACLPDRAKYFEEAWESASLSSQGQPARPSRLREPMCRIWDERNEQAPWLPALFLNATMVETGQRGIFSHLPVTTGTSGEFINSHDLHSHLRSAGPGAGAWQEVTLATAAHGSARFPLVSPPGRLPSGSRIVDGGYFENSGATTALDLLDAIDRYRKGPDRPGASARTPRVVLLVLNYTDTVTSPSPVMPGDELLGPALSWKVPDEEPNLQKTRNTANETTSILGTVLATRSARGSYATHALSDREAVASTAGIHVIHFTFTGLQIPLSWSLSQRSCSEMLRQFPRDPSQAREVDAKEAARKSKDPDAAAVDALIEKNRQATLELLDMLYPTPTATASGANGGTAITQ